MSDEKTRSSVEAARDTSAPVLPTVNPNVQAPQKPSDKLHPAIYVAYATFPSVHSSHARF